MADRDLPTDSPHRRVSRVGDTVRRPVLPWTPTVHALLSHLEETGFPFSPRPRGLDDQGREVVTFLPGESGPDGWAKVVPDDGLRAFARLLRAYHDAVADFRPPDDATWATGREDPDEGDVICHGDFGPWNVVWRGDRPVGIIDWDFAHPGPRMNDVAYALEYAAPFRDDAECLRWLRYPSPPDRRARVEVFCAAYGLATTAGVVDAVIDGQRRTARLVRTLGARGLEPQATWLADGYLAELDRRIEWSVANRSLFE